MKTKKHFKGLPPFVLMVCFIIILLSPFLLLISKQKTEKELLIKYPRMNNGVSMTECKKILNKNGVFYSDEEIERIRKVMELLCNVYYQQTNRKQNLISI
jgi:hypothetical protein